MWMRDARLATARDTDAAGGRLTPGRRPGVIPSPRGDSESQEVGVIDPGPTARGDSESQG